MFRMAAITALAVAAPLAGPLQAADLVLEKFFKGSSTATGSFSAINGVKRTFEVKLTGRTRNNTLILIEDFRYDDGERDRKTWRFTRTGPSTYRGVREDVIGDTTVHVSGDTARFTYLVDLDPGPEKNIVRFHDKLVLSSDGQTMVNTATVWKAIFPVARVRVDFNR